MLAKFLDEIALFWTSTVLSSLERMYPRRISDIRNQLDDSFPILCQKSGVFKLLNHLIQIFEVLMLFSRFSDHHWNGALQLIFYFRRHLVIVKHIEEAIESSNQPRAILFCKFVLIKYYHKLRFSDLFKQRFEKIWNPNHPNEISCVFISCHIY